MAVHGTFLYSILGKRMHWLNQRQNILAQNVANADTPNYSARDIAPMNFAKTVSGSYGVKPFTTLRTNAAHFAAKTSGGAGSFTNGRVRFPYEISPDKNGVQLEEQLKKMAQTQSQHTLALRVMRRYNTIYAESIGAGGGR